MQNKNGLTSGNFLLILEGILKKDPAWISEYDLIQQLKEQGYFEFLSSPALPDELFQYLSERHDLFKLFDGIVISGIENAGKPDKQYF